MIVIDASVFVAAIVDDEGDIYSQEIYEMVTKNEYIAVVPPMFYYETANVFLQIFRRRRISEDKYNNYLQALFEFPLIIDKEQSIVEVSAMAKFYELTVYDAAYLESAKRNNYSLASLDKQLVVAARKENIKLELNLK